MVTYDEFGPEKMIEVYDPKVGMHGFVVIDNTKLGPAKGGIRMTPTVSKDEVSRLARAMTWKNALANLPFGGGKSGIVANDKEITREEKEAIVRSFSKALKCVSPSEYIAAPDMNMAEQEVRWYVEENGNLKSATGKPSNMCNSEGKECGLPHELGSTGFGVAHATKVGAEYAGIDLNTATVAIEGYGNVGEFAAKFLLEMGAKITYVSDSKGTAFLKEGFNIEELNKVKKELGTVTKYKNCEVSESHSILKAEADILITAAVPDLIKESDLSDIKFKLISQGSNIPTTSEIEEKLFQKGVFVIPDFVANAGGVISSYAEHLGQTHEEMFKLVEKKIVENCHTVFNRSKEKNCKPRDAAMEIAVERIKG